MKVKVRRGEGVEEEMEEGKREEEERRS